MYCRSFITGLHTPLNVKAEAVNGTNFLIISWDFQAASQELLQPAKHERS